MAKKGRRGCQHDPVSIDQVRRWRMLAIRHPTTFDIMNCYNKQLLSDKFLLNLQKNKGRKKIGGKTSGKGKKSQSGTNIKRGEILH